MALSFKLVNFVNEEEQHGRAHLKPCFARYLQEKKMQHRKEIRNKKLKIHL